MGRIRTLPSAADDDPSQRFVWFIPIFLSPSLDFCELGLHIDNFVLIFGDGNCMMTKLLNAYARYYAS